MSAVFFDIETASASELYTYGSGFARLAGYAVDDGPVELTTDMDQLVRVIESADTVVAHNGLDFDLTVLHLYHGLDVGRLVSEGRVRDTLLLARQEDPPVSGGGSPKLSLDAIARRLGVMGKLACEGGESVLKTLAKEYGGFDKIPVDHVDYCAYLARDVEVLRDIAYRLPLDTYVEREHRVVWRLGALSRTGFRVDAGEVERQRRVQSEAVSRSQAKLCEDLGIPNQGAKPWTTTRGKEAVEQRLKSFGVAPPRTARGGLALGREALEALVSEHPGNTDLVSFCRVLVLLNGMRSTPATIAKHTTTGGRVHPRVSAGQSTGRFSVTEPGLTVMGKRERRNILERAMLVPDAGDLLLCCDLSQVDARAMAVCSGDPNYIAALAPGKDMHDEMAIMLFGPAEGSGHHPRRNDAKAITHATSYGMGAKALARETGILEAEAGLLLRRLDENYRLLAGLKERVRKQVEVGAAVVTPFGRRICVAADKAYTQAPAALGQGTARDILAEAILRLPDWLVPCLRAVVHDELVLSVPADRVDEARRDLKRAMQFNLAAVGGGPRVPILAECSAAGRDWLDCYRHEKSDWPEVSRDHRDQDECGDSSCTWHVEDK